MVLQTQVDCAHLSMVDKHTNAQTHAWSLTGSMRVLTCHTNVAPRPELPNRACTQDAHSHTDSFPGCTNTNQGCLNPHSLRQHMACVHVQHDRRWLVNTLAHATDALQGCVLTHTCSHVHTDIHSASPPTPTPWPLSHSQGFPPFFPSRSWTTTLGLSSAW